MLKGRGQQHACSDEQAVGLLQAAWKLDYLKQRMSMRASIIKSIKSLFGLENAAFYSAQEDAKLGNAKKREQTENTQATQGSVCEAVSEYSQQQTEVI